MARPIISVFVIVLLCLNIAIGQSNLKGRPDLPGAFVVDFGLNRPINTPDDFSTGLWGSRSVSVYYQQDITLPFSKRQLAFAPGVGFGFDRYKFKNNYTLLYESDNLTLGRNGLDISKSHLVTNYIDLRLELKYINNPDDPDRSLKISAGFRPGYLISGFTKIKYDDEDLGSIKEKKKADWNLNRFRYGIYGKVGFGNFSVFCNYNLSTLFTSDQGPDESSINTVTFGISLSSF